MEVPLHPQSEQALESALSSLDATGKRVLLESRKALIGVKRYIPGEVFPNHFHRGYDEYLAILSGRLTLWTDRAERTVLIEGDSYLVARGVHHCLINDSNEPAEMLFAKVPFVENDSTWVDWNPTETAGGVRA